MGRIACVLRTRACLAEPTALSPSTMKSLVPSGSSLEQAVSLAGTRSSSSEVVADAGAGVAGEAELARVGGGLALDLALRAAAEPLLHPLDDRAQERAA